MTLHQRLNRPRRRIVALFALVFFASPAVLALNEWVDMGGAKGGDGSTPFTGLTQGPEVNLFSGSMSVSVPIQVPPGRPLATPDLALSYNSASGSSPYGFGWRLPIGTIERSAKHGVPSCALTGGPGNSDDFILDMNGATADLVYVSGDLYRAEYDEAYVEAQKDTAANEWTVHDRRGMTYRFGQTIESRASTGTDEFMSTASGCHFTAVWSLTQVSDPNGNVIDIFYVKDGNVSYPSEIQYGANPTAALFDHPFRVAFTWVNRSFPPDSRIRGIVEIEAKVIDKIDVYYKPGSGSGSQLFRTYNFSHAQDPTNARMLLNRVDTLDHLGVPIVPEQKFTYSSSDLEILGQATSFPAPKTWLRHMDPSSVSPVRPTVLQTFMDMNGDGRTDLLVKSEGSDTWLVHYGTGTAIPQTAVEWERPTGFGNKALRFSEPIGQNTTVVKYDTVDLTGDGIPDFVDAFDMPWIVYKGACEGPTDCGFLPGVTWASPQSHMGRARKGISPPVTVTYQSLIDINGDGRPDLLTLPDHDFANPWLVYLNTGTGFTAEPWAGFSLTGAIGSERRQSDGTHDHANFQRTEVMLMDFNGDGLPDRLRHDYDKSGVYTSGPLAGQSTGLIYGECTPSNVSAAGALSVELNNGRGFDAPIFSATPYFHPDHEGDGSIDGAMAVMVAENDGGKETRPQAELIDVNADGLPDWVYQHKDDTPLRAVFNMGGGRLGPIVFPTASTYPCGDPRTRPGDQPAWSTIPWYMRHQFVDEDPGHNYTNADVVDITGDGLLDYLRNGASWTMRAAVNPDGESLRPNLLQTVDNGYGGITEVRYEPSTHFAYDNAVQDPRPELPFITWVVTAIRKSDGLCPAPATAADRFDPVENGCIGAGHEIHKTYVYEDGVFDPVRREFRGFGLVVETDIEGNDRVIEFSQDDATRGKILSEEIFAGSEPVRRTTSVWATRSSLGRTQIYLAEHKVEHLPAHTASPPAAQCMVTRNEPPDDFGRVTSTCSLACNGGSAGQCSPAVAGQVETTTTWAMPESSSYHVYDRPAHVETAEYSSESVSTTLVSKDFYYDDQTIGITRQGNVRRVSTPVGFSHIGFGGAAEVYTFHDPFGNVTSIVDPNLHVTTYQYSPSNFKLYPVTKISPTTNGVPHVVSTETDLRFGKPSQVTDENNGVSVWTYDALGRVTCEAGPGDDCSPALDGTVSYAYQFGNPVLPFEGKLSFVETRRVDPHAASGYVAGRTYVDALGRTRAKMQERVVGTDTALSRVISAQTDYDAKGRGSKVYAAYVATGALQDVPPTSGEFTSHVYGLNGSASPDPLDRPHIVTPPDGNETTTFYEGTRTRIVDPRGDETRSIRDAFGREIRREEYSGSSVLEMSFDYTYDGLGRVTKTVISGNAATAVTQKYDGLGRVFERVDPDSGTWQFGYDRGGNLLFQNDPKSGQHLQMCYDALDRIQLRCTFSSDSYDADACSNGCSAVESEYTYDDISGGNKGIGQLTYVEDSSGSETSVYDERGRVIESTKVVQGRTDATAFAFDEGDHLATTTYPDGEVVESLYGAGGQLVGVEQQNGSIFVSDIDYDLFGRAQFIAHGNGIGDRQVFYGAAERFRLQSLRVEASGPDYLDLDYGYNDLGKIEYIDDNRDTTYPRSNTADFTYDALGRLTEVDAVSYPQGFTYDSLGNITQAGNGAIYYNPVKPHQAQLRGFSLQVQHDDNGNLSFKQTQAGGISNGYDKLDRLVTSSVWGGATQTHTYDYTGRRVSRQAGGVTERYFSKLVEFDGNLVTKYYYAGERLIAARWYPDSTFGTQAPPGALIQLPPELPVAVGTIAIFLLLGFGRRERRVGIAVGPSRAVGTAVLLLGIAPPIGLFSATAAYADCDPDLNILHYHLDHLGSTQVITNYEGLIYQQIRYTAYGEVRGRWDQSGAAFGVDIAGLTREFTGYESDAVTGFQYAGARYFDPELAQFLSHDPAKQFASPYAYGPGDPVNSVDPNGEFSVSVEIHIDTSSGDASVDVSAGGSARGGADFESTGFALATPSWGPTARAAELPSAALSAILASAEKAAAGYGRDVTKVGANAPMAANLIGEENLTSGVSEGTDIRIDHYPLIVGNHAEAQVLNPDPAGQDYRVSGGPGNPAPSLSGQIGRTLSTALGGDQFGTVTARSGNEPKGVPEGALAGKSVIVRVPLPFDKAVAEAKRYVDLVNSSNVRYSSFGPNSNTVAYGLSPFLGGPLATPPVFAPGGGPFPFP